MGTVTKIYKVRANAAVLNFFIGKSTIRAEFKNGNLREGRYAILTTNNPLVQFAIEHDSRFGTIIIPDSSNVIAKQAIKLENVTKSETKLDQRSEDVSDSRNGEDITNEENVVNIQDAINFLSQKGIINIEDVKGTSALKIRTIAKDNGYVFPKWRERGAKGIK